MEQKIITEYFKRSYFSLDGLWFVMIEEESSFDKAMEIDEKVWRVLPKIQARKVKELLNLKGIGLADFLRAIKFKLEAEGYDYEVRGSSPDHAQIAISACPWYDILKKAKRENLASRIADAICALEFRVWLSEFCQGWDLKFEPGCCVGKPECLVDFRAR